MYSKKGEQKSLFEASIAMRNDLSGNIRGSIIPTSVGAGLIGVKNIVVTVPGGVFPPSLSRLLDKFGSYPLCGIRHYYHMAGTRETCVSDARTAAAHLSSIPAHGRQANTRKNWFAST